MSGATILAFVAGLCVGFGATHEWFCHMSLRQYWRYRALAFAMRGGKR
ncbi:hypothetical protein [Rhodococcus sp. B10]|nr:hypothetical protein [Rhodococcus sp. B10]